jgi:hypothetical protein
MWVKRKKEIDNSLGKASLTPFESFLSIFLL